MSKMDIYYALDTWIEGSCVKDIKRRTALPLLILAEIQSVKLYWD